MRTIPQYSEDFAAGNHRKQRSVLEKLRTKYGAEPAVFEAALAPEIDDLTQISRVVHGTGLTNRIKECCKFSSVSLQADQEQALRQECQTLAESCFRIDRLRTFVDKQAREAQEPAFERDSLTSRIVDIYANHCVIESLARIKSFGFSDRSAFALAGMVIGGMKREIKPLKPESAAGMNDWFQKILTFAATERDGVNRAHKLMHR